MKDFKDFMLEKKKLAIFCDLDGVLVNFEKGIKDLKKELNITDENIWLDLDEDWWTNLSWMKDGKGLWNHIKKHSPTILTALPRTKKNQAIRGKKKWVEAQLGKDIKIICTTKSQKQSYCDHDQCILIDDSSENIDRWKNAGGIAIHHKNTKDTINKLKKIQHGIV